MATLIAATLIGQLACREPTGPAGPASIVTMNAGDGQVATAGQELGIRPSVKVTDSAGRAVSGASVTFAVVTGGGSVTIAEPTTNGRGIASVGSWTLGTIASTNTLTATATGLSGSPISFTATGIAGAAANLAVNAGNNQSETAGTTVATAPSVIATDVNGNAVGGVSVTFAVTGGGGVLTNGIQTTNNSGIATLGSWTLGATPNAGNTLSATSAGLTGSPVTFAATGVASIFVTLIAGGSQTCGLTSTGAAYCWGGQSSGVVGDDSTTIRTTPVAVPGGLLFASLSVGGHTCGVTGAGAAYCWGGNTYGQLGDGSTTRRTSPVAVSGGIVFASVTAGVYHSCGRTSGGVTYCWGNNAGGQLGDSTISGDGSSTPTSVLGGHVFASLAVGKFYTCGVKAGGAAFCWGDNYAGQLGDGSDINRRTPAAVSGGLVFASLTAAFDYTCGVTSGGLAYCWGANGNGQLGDGTTTDRLSPVAVSTGLVFSSLIGNDHKCGLTSAGAAYCWGDNSGRQLGDGTNIRRNAPVAVMGGLVFTSLTAGENHTCGMTSAGAAYCWGANDWGQLGNRSTIGGSAPGAVRNP